MGFYDEEETARQYIAMAEGYDGKALIATLSAHLPKGATVLEIGMGPGKDLDLLARDYRVTGSDASTYFVELYRRHRPEADLLILDAITLETDRSFDCIYSNKVLHHLSDAELDRSLRQQTALLTPGGWLMHSFWSGEGKEEMHGLSFFYRSEDWLRAHFEQDYEIVDLETYAELAPGDTIAVLARLKR